MNQVKMTPEEQIDLWVNGKSMHNPDRDECCPDFSCCRPELAASNDERLAFVEAWNHGDTNSINAMFFGFLAALLQLANETADACILLVNGEEFNA